MCVAGKFKPSIGTDDQLTDCICILGHAPPGSNKFNVGALVTARVLRIVVQEPGVDVQGDISGGFYNDLYNGTITADNGDDTFSVMYDSAIDGPANTRRRLDLLVVPTAQPTPF